MKVVVANQLISLDWLQGHPLFFAQAQLLDSLKSQNSLCLLLNVTRSGRKREETMSISLNSAVGFKSTLQTKYHHVSRPKAASLGMLASRI
ncbi:hypothetical protein NC653_020548 [Populus alba x Populus x berolinensis]|uniref:Uncharacterized protein n=1 Tax=Populus alba x Populus x berolinensis TaxID=444605 RepID=A0AAD6MKT4_9ROSI|nr:hypothetical protein NC653_020548 [Populus alba x Populus x berolinensis]